MEQSEWIEIGQKNGWIGLIFDWLQSGPELSENELNLVENGSEPEISCVRIYLKGEDNA